MENLISGKHLRQLNRLGLFAGLFLLFFVYPAFAQPEAEREATWVTNGTVRAIARTTDTVYIGGDFTYVGPNTGNGVPIDSTTGQNAPVFPKVNGEVYACAPDGSGGWYIGGYFTKVGNLTRTRIAHILADGSVDAAWNPSVVGNPLMPGASAINAIAVSGSTVYVGGQFSSIGGQTRNNIAAIDAVSGAPTPWNPGANGIVYALAVSGTTVYAGGSFTSMGLATRDRIAAINAVSGAVSDWNPAANGIAYALAVSGSTVYAAGGFTNIGGQARNYIAAIDAVDSAALSWNPGANGVVRALAVSGSTIYAAGGFSNIGGQTRNRIAAIDAVSGAATSWNPSTWNPGPWLPTDNTYVYALAVSDSKVYSGGSRGIGGQQVSNFIAAIEAESGAATSWNSSADGVVRVLAVSGSTVYAGGSFTSVGRQPRNHIAAIDVESGAATSWNPGADSGIYALAVSGSTVYAGGGFINIGGQARNRIAAIDSATGTPTAWNPSANNHVYALAVSGSKVYAGGSFTSMGLTTRNRIAAIDAVSGAPTAWNPGADGSIAALALSGSTVYAGGGFTSVGGQARSSIAAIDAMSGSPTSWNPSPWNGPTGHSGVYALALSGSTVYVGGSFASIGGQARNNIAAIDAVSGAALGWNPGPSGGILSISVSGSTVYAGGGYMGTGYLAAIDAVSGAPLGWNPGPSGAVLAISISDSTVYAGGNFGSIGGRSCPYFAQLAPAPTPAGPAAPGATEISHNGITWIWPDTSSDESGYLVYAGAGATAPATAIATTAPNVHHWRHSGLSPNSQYAFQVAATNSSGNSAKSDNYTTYTLIEPVAPLVFSDIDADSISVGTDNNLSKLSSGSSGLYFANTTKGTNSGWQKSAAPWVSSGLSPNTYYAFSGKSRNMVGMETAPTTSYCYTHAATPLAPVVNNPRANSLDVAIAPGDGNPANTQYALYCQTTSQWIQPNGSLGALPAWNTASGWATKTVTGLSPSTAYAFHARARNTSQVETPNGPAVSRATRGPSKATRWNLYR